MLQRIFCAVDSKPSEHFGRDMDTLNTGERQIPQCMAQSTCFSFSLLVTIIKYIGTVQI